MPSLVLIGIGGVVTQFVCSNFLVIGIGLECGLVANKLEMMWYIVPVLMTHE